VEVVVDWGVGIDWRERDSCRGSLGAEIWHRKDSRGREERRGDSFRWASRSLASRDEVKGEIAQVMDRGDCTFRGRGHRFPPEGVLHGIDLDAVLRQDAVEVVDSLLQNGAEGALLRDAKGFEGRAAHWEQVFIERAEGLLPVAIERSEHCRLPEMEELTDEELVAMLRILTSQSEGMHLLSSLGVGEGLPAREPADEESIPPSDRELEGPADGGRLGDSCPR
jgi:hypothetical protein